MMRAEPRIFDPAWLYRPITAAFGRAAEILRYIQAGPLGLYLLYLLLAFVAVLRIAGRNPSTRRHAPRSRGPASGLVEKPAIYSGFSTSPRILRPRLVLSSGSGENDGRRMARGRAVGAGRLTELAPERLGEGSVAAVPREIGDLAQAKSGRREVAGGLAKPDPG